MNTYFEKHQRTTASELNKTALNGSIFTKNFFREFKNFEVWRFSLHSLKSYFLRPTEHYSNLLKLEWVTISRFCKMKTFFQIITKFSTANCSQRKWTKKDKRSSKSLSTFRNTRSLFYKQGLLYLCLIYVMYFVIIIFIFIPINHIISSIQTNLFLRHLCQTFSVRVLLSFYLFFLPFSVWSCL